MDLGFFFIFSAFFAGFFTFLAPCTLPLVPAYLGFISGVKEEDFKDPARAKKARRKILTNGVSFIFGFCFIFVTFGILVGLLGQSLASFEYWIARVGGVVIILFGLFMLGAIGLPYLKTEKHFDIATKLPRGNTKSSFLIGSAFAFGWTPCIGPVLGTILLLAGTGGTALGGGLLLLVFSFGLATPFLLVAFFFARSTKYIKQISKYLSVISFIGGLFLVFLGTLLLTDNFSLLIRYGFEFLNFIGYQDIVNYL